MPAISSRRKQISGLLSQADQFEDRLSVWQQQTPPPTPAEVRAAQREYATWYAEARPLVLDDDRAGFVDMYEGGQFTSRIRAFLNDPTSLSPLHDPSRSDPLIPKWKHTFQTVFRDNFARQRELLAHALHATTNHVLVLDEVAAVLRRLPEFLSVLQRADRFNVPRPTIENEADLQVLTHALLRLLYDDVRPEDPVPQHAGGSSRVDFLLREAGVVIETKMTRLSLTDRKLGEELMTDWGRYPRHPDCRAILALVYDPGRHLANPAALEHDLSRPEPSPPTRVIVVR